MNSKNDLEIPVYLFMFRKQQQSSNSQQIKSFSSRVGRRGTKKQEEKEEYEEPVRESVKPAKSIKPQGKGSKKVVNAGNLPNLKEGVTPITINDVENIYLESVGSKIVVIVIKPIVGPKDFSEPIDVSGNSVYAELVNTTGIQLKLIQREVTVYNSNKGTRLFDGDEVEVTFKVGENNTTKTATITKLNCTIERLNIITKPVTSGEMNWSNADVTFQNGMVNLGDYQKYASYTSTITNGSIGDEGDHSDVGAVYFTNQLYSGSIGQNSPTPVYNIVVKGEIPQWVYEKIHVPTGDNDKYAFKIIVSEDNGSGREINNEEGNVTISTVNGLPKIGDNGDMNDINSMDLSEVALGEPTGGQIDIRNKFDNFYVNNVIIKPSSANDLVTRFTQSSGTGYLGSNVTILAAPNESGSGVTEPVNDPLVPLISDITYENNTITFTIKPNEKSGLLSENRENAGSTSEPVEVSDHIIIDLSGSTLSDKLANWTPSTTNNNIKFIQEAVILYGEWNNNVGPVIGLNGYKLNATTNKPEPEAINKITIKYFKKGDATAGTSDEIATVNLVTGTPSTTPADKEFNLGTVSNTINMLYLVNGKVDLEMINGIEIRRLLTPLSDAFSSATTEGVTTYSISKVPELVKVDNTTTPSEGQIGLYDRTKVKDNTTNATIDDFCVTNLIPKFDPSADKPEKIVNLVVNGTLPDWTIGSTLWKDEVQEKGKYGYKVTQDGTTKDKWTIGTGSKHINRVNWLPVDGYGELDIGVDFTTTAATLGSPDSPIELPEDSTGTKNELKLLNFNMNEIYVKQNKSTADLDLTATVDHNYEGTTVHNAAEMGRVTGTASPITDLISGFEVLDKALFIKIRPSNKKNILKDYRKGNDTDANKKEINLDITGNLNLCNSLVSILNGVELTGVIIEQEALILDDSSISNIPLDGDLTFKGVDITMNESVEITSFKLKYLKKGTDESYSEEELSFTTTGLVNHNIDEFYFVHGTISNERLLKPLSASSTFTEDKKIVLEDVLVPNSAEGENEITLLAETISIIEKVHLTNIINGIEANGKSNLLVNGEIPKWVYDDFVGGTGIAVPAIEGNNTTPAWTLSTVNDFPCSGYGELDIGIDGTTTSTLNLITIITGKYGADENTVTYGKPGFYVDEVTLPVGVDEVNAQFTRHNGLVTEGSNIQITNIGNSPVNPDDPTNAAYIKISTLDQLYNLMIEPRQLDENGILKDEPADVSENDITTKVLEEGYYLHYSPTLAKGLERLVINGTENNADGYFSVRIKCERLTEAEETESALYRIYLEYTNQGVTHIIPYGVIGNGAFPGSQLDPRFEVNGNKYNLKIESIMNGINEREIEEVQGKLELSNKAKTDESVKIKKSEMYEYICEMKRTFQVMAYNMRYINEVLGYLSKCLAFEEIRLPSIRESDNQGLESVNEEYDSETNPNGWIEKYTEEFFRNDILYKVTPSYENYRFKEGGKHDNLIRDMQNKVNQIYMYYTLSEGSNEALGLDYTMTVMINEFMDIWMKYYKGLVVPNNVIISEYSDIEIYEDEHIYKVFEGDEEGVHIISKLTDGRSEDTDGEELKRFIEELMMYFKDEINEITGNKKEIKSVTIEDTVAYADPLKEYTDSNVDENESIDNVLTNNENNLIEYSQMLSTIQGERNKLQRQGNKNKFILKFTQTVKGTFFEMFGKEKVNTDSKSIIFGFFISELQRVINHIVQNREMRNADRKAKRGIRHEVSAIPEQIDGKWYLRITKIPEFYKGDPLDWINDSYYSNKIFLQNCDNLYIGIDPELDQRIFPVGTPKDNNSSEFKEQEMIGYYILKVNY